MYQCHFCSTSITLEGKVSRSDVCPHCKSDLRCCLNCRFHNDSAHNQCDEPQAEHVAVRDKSNFCDYFEFRRSTGTASTDEASDARDRFDSLFK